MSSCEECGTDYEQTAKHKRFCCERCQRKAEKRRYRERHAEQTKCKGCGDWFKRSSVDGRPKVYCTTDCQHRTRSTTYHDRDDIGRPNLGTMDYYKALRADPCAYCGRPGGEIDHIHARSNGGEDGWENYSGICKTCNARKGRRSVLNFMLARPLMEQVAAIRGEIPPSDAVTPGGDPSPETQETAGVVLSDSGRVRGFR